MCCNLLNNFIKRLFHTYVMEQNQLKIQLELGGGAELLFNNVRKQTISLPSREDRWTIRSLLVWLKDNLLSERPELFLKDESVRPGIVVLVNDVDWEIIGELNYVLKNDDNVMFLSTLHGG